MERPQVTGAPDDRLLVAAASQGDREAFRILVERHQRSTYSLTLNVLRNVDDARDACQDAFVRAWRGLANFRGDAAFSSWLHRIAMNGCLDRLRRRQPTEPFDESVAFDGDPGATIAASHFAFNPEGAAGDHELRDQIRDSLDQLSPAHRAVLVLREVEGLSYAEIAEVMNCAVGTVMSRLFHARKNMQAALLRFGAEAPWSAVA